MTRNNPIMTHAQSTARKLVGLLLLAVFAAPSMPGCSTSTSRLVAALALDPKCMIEGETKVPPLFSANLENQARDKVEMLPKPVQAAAHDRLDRCRSLNQLEQRLEYLTRHHPMGLLLSIEDLASKINAEAVGGDEILQSTLDKLVEFPASLSHRTLRLKTRPNMHGWGAPFQRSMVKMKVRPVRWVDILAFANRMESTAIGLAVSQLEARSRFRRPRFADAKMEANGIRVDPDFASAAKVREDLFSVDLRRQLNVTEREALLDGLDEICPDAASTRILPNPSATEVAFEVMAQFTKVWEEPFGEGGGIERIDGEPAPGTGPAPVDLQGLRIWTNQAPGVTATQVELTFSTGSTTARIVLLSALAKIPCIRNMQVEGSELMQFGALKGWRKYRMSFDINCPPGMCSPSSACWCMPNSGANEPAEAVSFIAREERRPLLKRLDKQLGRHAKRWESLEDEVASPAVKKWPEAKGPQVAFLDGAKETSEWSYTLQKTMMVQACADLGQIFKGARLIPNYDRESGTYRGLKLIGVRPTGFYHAIGIRAGDVLTRVDDEELQSPSEMIRLVEVMCLTEPLTIRIKRKGVEQTISYAFE